MECSSALGKGNNYLLILSLLLLAACAKEKDTIPAKLYHSTTSYFNYYYNADQLFKETTRTLEEQYVFPEQGFIEVIYYGTEDEAESLKGELDRIIEKNDAVVFKHPNGLYIDNCRFLTGKCWFYQRDYENAQTNFDYVLEKFPESKLLPDLWFWKAKSFYFDSNPEMAFSILNEYFIDQDTFEISKDLLGDLNLFRTRIAIDQGEYKQAISFLEEGVDKIKGHERRNRGHYLLGQLYAESGEFARSLEQFNHVMKSTNDYDLAFSAKMRVARLYIDFQAEQSGESVYKYLEKLLKDEKNEEYKDQIFYQYAMLELNKGNREGGIDYLNQSVRANVNNDRQRALSYYKLGQLSFDVQDYDNAQAYYDSAAMVIKESAPEYKEITGIAATLKEYINYKNTIHYQDSMIYLAGLDEKKLEQLINRIVAEEKRKEKEKEAALQAQTNDPFYNPMLNQNSRRPTRPGQNTGGIWYFDNPTAISNGKLQFQQTWGQRKNEDDWRRIQKNSISSGGDAELANAEIDSALVEKYGDKAKYYKDIPENEEEIALAHEKIEKAMYKLGQLYSQKLNEPDSAVEVFEEQLKRYPDGEYALRAHYALFKIFAANGDRRSEKHKAFILDNHPNTVYAMLVEGKDPRELRKEEEEFKYAYKGLFSAYSLKQYETTIGFSEFLLAQAELGSQAADLDLARLHYIRGMSYGFTGDKDSLFRILTYVVNTYPEAEVTPMAKKTLALMDNPGGVALETDTNPQSILPEDPGDAIADENNPRYDGFAKEIKANDKIFVLMFIDKNKISKKDATAKVSNFNYTNYREKNLKVFTFLYKQTHLLPYISHFKTVEEAETYIEGFQAAEEGPALLMSADEKIFYISHSNFKVAYGQKRMEDYMAFYEQILSQ